MPASYHMSIWPLGAGFSLFALCLSIIETKENSLQEKAVEATKQEIPFHYSYYSSHHQDYSSPLFFHADSYVFACK
jgi:hypothetical protein